MPTNEQRLVELAQRLLKQTEAKKLKWEVADDSQRDFELNLPSGSINIVFNVDGSYELRVYNETGAFVERLQTSALRVLANPWDETVRSLYDLAREDALSIDPLISSLLRDLEQA